jgi:hypothetical protein
MDFRIKEKNFRRKTRLQKKFKKKDMRLKKKQWIWKLAKQVHK